MKNATKLEGRLESNVLPDRRFRHGLYSNAVKLYRKLDWDIRNSENPTPEMFELLGMALVTALDTVTRATNVSNRYSWDKYREFLKIDVIRTRQILGVEAERNFRNLNARHGQPIP